MSEDSMFYQPSLFEDLEEPPQEIPDTHVFRREISSEDVRQEASMSEDSMFGHQLSLPLFEDRGEPPQEIPDTHVFRREISSKDVRAEMLLKLPKNDPQIRHLRNLHRFARRGRKGLEIITPEAAWSLVLVGKSETRRWRWNLCQRQLG